MDTPKAITPRDQSGLENYQHRSEHPTCISFCAGYGGIERGLQAVYGGLSVLAISEIEAFPAARTLSKMEDGTLEAAPIWTDLKTFPGETLRGCVDILTGGFPCQPFSAAGRRGGDEDPRHLFPYFIKAIRVMRPKQVFLQNVAGIPSPKSNAATWDTPTRHTLLPPLS